MPAFLRWPALPVQVALWALSLSAPTLAQSGVDHPSNHKHQVSAQVSSRYQHWLDQDVRWIITPEERDAFVQLSSDRERDRFIEEFWQRRDPTPETPENEFKEEHYRRIAYSDMHFGWAKVQGWETDRGRIYIFYGPPDSILNKPMVTDSGGSKTAQIWHYNYMEHRGSTGAMNVRFIDWCGCGDYRLLQNPTRKDMPGY